MATKTTVVFVISCFLCVTCYLDIPEGAPCYNNGVKGTCAKLFQCYSAAWATLYQRSGFDYEPLPEVCSYDETDEPIYCCSDCRLDRNETLRNYVVVPGGRLQERNKRKAWNKCMEYFQTLPYKCRGEGYRFTFPKYDEERECFNTVTYPGGAGGVGGRDAKLWELPHMALLGYGASRESAQWLCGGSVISERFILTAAHCSSAPNLGPISYAGLGILKRTDLNTWNVYKIIRIIVHPQYKSPSKYHDIALVQTANEINFGRGLLPACVDIGVRTNTYDPYLSAPGWGRLGHNKPLADTLQVMELRPFDQDKCAAIFPPHRHLRGGYNYNTQMCYGATEDSAVTDTCEGDSGGPANYEDFCMYVVVGVTSFGRNCGTKGSAGMYTRVRAYVPWIESIVWP